MITTPMLEFEVVEENILIMSLNRSKMISPLLKESEVAVDNILKKETGMMDRFYEPYLKSTKRSCPDEQTIRPVLKIPKPVGLHTIFSLCLIIISGIAFSLIVLVIEKIREPPYGT